jgi:hypothetical protein
MTSAIIVAVVVFIVAVAGYAVTLRRKRKADPKNIYPLF